MRWSVGVTTVPARRADLLPQTLASLAAGGFVPDRLFLDDGDHCQALDYEDEFGIPVTVRQPILRVAGNWTLALHELYLREPKADAYLMAQDDFLTCRNLRAYLEACAWPARAYLNLYSSPAVQRAADGHRHKGWFRTPQNGRGAVALVFPNEAVRLLLASQHMVNRPYDSPTRGWRAVDGGIVESLGKAGWREHCHNPPLVHHVGFVSAMDKNKRTADYVPNFAPYHWPKEYEKTAWPGEAFDALDLLK